MKQFAVPLVCLASIVPITVQAHPHIFVDTGYEIILDAENRLTHIRVTWAYDEFYSLLIAEDLQIDQDYDGIIQPEDMERLVGFDMKWVDGFAGDLYLSIGNLPLELSGPTEVTADIEDGRIVTTHLRAVSARPGLESGTVSVKSYDPTFYTAYEVTRPVRVTGPLACMIDRIEPDIDGQMEEVRRRLAQLGPNDDPEAADIPLISGEFAEDVRISCPAT